MSTSGIRAGRAFVELGVDDKLTRALQNAQAKMRAFASGVQRVGTGLAASGVALGTPIAFATLQFANFDDAMRGVGAISQSSEADLKSMTATASELGRTTSFTSQEVALLMQELAKGGFNPSQINAMTLAVLDLSRATGTDAALSASIMKNAIKQFGLEASDAARVADVLTKTANSTNTTVEGIGESMVYAATTAKRLGMTFEETAALMGLLGDRGIEASSAGTVLRRIATIASSTGDELKRIFNVSNTDASGQFKGVAKILSEISQSTALMSTTEKSKALSDAFGLLAIDAAEIIGTGGPVFDELVQKLQNAEGTANETAKAMDAGLGGAFRRILSAVDGVANAIGAGIEGGLSRATDAFTTVLGSLTEFLTANKAVAQGAAVTAAVLVGGGAALIGLGLAARVAAVGLQGALIVIKTVQGAVALMQFAFTAAKVAILVTQAALLASQGTYAGVAAGIIAMNAAQALSPALSAAMAAAYTATGAIITGVTTLASGTVGLLGLAWSAAAAIASGSWIGSGGIIATVTTAASAAGVAGAGLLGTAWSAVAAAAATAWTTMLAPLIPLLVPLLGVVVVLGSVTALMGVAAAKAGLFGSAWSGIKSVFTDLWAVASETFGGITAAMSGGQYAKAAEILWAGVKAAFWTGMSAIADGLSYFFTNFISGTIAFGKSLLKTIWSVFTAIPKMIWKALTSGKSISELISDAMKGVGSNFDSMATRAANARQELARLNNEAQKSRTAAEVLAAQAKEIKSLKDSQARPATAEETEAANDKKMRHATPEDRAKYLANKENLKRDQEAAKQSADDSETARLIEERSAALRKEADELNRGTDAAERHEFAQRGATEAQLAAYDAAQAAKQAAKVDSDIRERIKSLNEEAVATRHGSEAAERHKLALMGATSAQLAALKAAQANADAAQQSADMQSAGESLAAAMRTPFEIFRDELQEANALLMAGTIDPTDFRRKKSQLQKQFLDANDTPEERQATYREQQRSVDERVASGEITAEQASAQMQTVARLLEQARIAADAAGKGMDNQTKTAGTFDGFALGRLGGRDNNLAKETAEATKATAANTAEIAANSKRKPQRFGS